MRASGLMINRMELEKKYGQMGQIMKENIRMERNKEREY